MIPSRFKSLTPFCLALLALSGAASAQTLAPGAAPTGIKLSEAVFAASAGRDIAGPSQALGLAPTAVDHSFSSSGLMASAGFLCGLKSAPDNNGAASALGYDPHGRFVGARLSYAFR